MNKLRVQVIDDLSSAGGSSYMIKATSMGNGGGVFDMSSSASYVVKANNTKDVESDGSFCVDNDTSRLNDLRGSILSKS